MLTFFRRIRKGLLATGATRKYLLYAIGEIALVVIGILIALQINNWNQERLNQIEESKFLSKIYNDIKSDTSTLNFLRKSTRDKSDFLISILNNELTHFTHVKKGPLNIFVSRMQHRFSPRDNGIKEIINSGKLNIIRNELLKEKILNYYRFVEERNVTLSSKFSEWPKLLSELVPGELSYKARAKPSGEFTYENEQLIIKNIMTSRDRLEKSINAELGYAGVQEYSYYQLLLRANNLLSSLSSEINNQ